MFAKRNFACYSGPMSAYLQTLKILGKLVAQSQAFDGATGKASGHERAKHGQPQKPQPQGISKPGCTVADETLMVHGHLTGLARGWGGFGVLRESSKRLAKAVEAARSIKAEDVVKELEQVAQKLPDVHTPEAAQQVAASIEPLLPKVWELGRRCGASPELWKKAQDLAAAVQRGDKTKEEAIRMLKQGVISGTTE